MRTGSLLFFFGILCLMGLPGLPTPFLLCLFPVGMFIFWRFPKFRWVAFLLSGFLWALFRAELILSNELEPDLEGQTITVEGQVIGLPVYKQRNIRFDFKIHALWDQSGRLRKHPRKIRLNWYGHYPELRPEQVWRLNIRLRRPHGFMNPGGFDYEAWLFQAGIRASGYVRAKEDGNRLISTAPGISIQSLRFEIRKRLSLHYKEHPMGPLLPALGLGDRGTMTNVQWQVLTRSGTNHLLAISGLHIGVIAGFAYFIFRWLWSICGLHFFSLAAPRFAAIGAIIFASLYAAMAGFAIPSQRALIMLVVVLSLMFFYRRTSISHIMAIALFLVLLWDPFAVLSAGFCLSFSAVAIILYGMAYRTQVGGFWWRWGRVQLLIAIALLPLLIFWFQQAPVLSALANFVAVPWVSMVSVPLVMMGCAMLMLHETSAIVILDLAVSSLEAIWWLLEWIAAFDSSVLYQARPSVFVLVCAILGVLLLLLPAGVPGRYLGLIWMMPLFFTGGNQPSHGQFRLSVLDVGQGLAAVVQTHNHTLLYDTGPAFSESFNAGDDVILPFLRAKNIHEIDLLVLSHGDSDHIGGLKDVLNGIHVKNLLTSVPEKTGFAKSHYCQRGQSWEWEGVRMEILSPAAVSVYQGNNSSCVLQISNGDSSVLLTGDIETSAETALVHKYDKDLSSTVLIAPHHGSLTSSSPAFIEAVKPDLVLFPVGYGNRFGFPKQDIIHRYEERGIKMLDTATSGAIEYQSGENGGSLGRYRLEKSRFWHRPE